ncbi:hypothetical protein K474DRAFT_1202577 [Panus rudis PR-1116 ss-1]|nr:hypothetical protein K474DRAFT_1202577 [Panus rudis PR-1116 ss-1]
MHLKTLRAVLFSSLHRCELLARKPMCRRILHVTRSCNSILKRHLTSGTRPDVTVTNGRYTKRGRQVGVLSQTAPDVRCGGGVRENGWARDHGSDLHARRGRSTSFLEPRGSSRECQ